MGNRYLELEDVDNVHLKLHPLVYTNKTWTPRKLLFRMRRDVILDVLSQVGFWLRVDPFRRSGFLSWEYDLMCVRRGDSLLVGCSPCAPPLCSTLLDSHHVRCTQHAPIVCALMSCLHKVREFGL